MERGRRSGSQDQGSVTPPNRDGLQAGAPSSRPGKGGAQVGSLSASALGPLLCSLCCLWPQALVSEESG